MSDETHRTGTGPSHLLVENAVAGLTMAFGVVVLAGSWQVGVGWGVEGPKAGFFPFYISLFIIGSSLVNLFQLNSPGSGEREYFSTWEELRRVMSVVVPLVAYVAFVPLLGMYVSSILLIAVFMLWLGGYSLWKTLPIAIGVPVLAYFVFERYFQIALPKGPVEYWLGL